MSLISVTRPSLARAAKTPLMMSSSVGKGGPGNPRVNWVAANTGAGGGGDADCTGGGGELFAGCTTGGGGEAVGREPTGGGGDKISRDGGGGEERVGGGGEALGGGGEMVGGGGEDTVVGSGAGGPEAVLCKEVHQC